MANVENGTNNIAISLDSFFKDIPVIDKNNCGKLPEIKFPTELTTLEEFITFKLNKRRLS